MSHRHSTRQPDLDRERGRHDPHPIHHGQHPPPPPLLNGAGGSMPPAPAPLSLNGGPPPPHHSPTVGPAGGPPPPNGPPVPPTLAKLASANEDTWLLIGRVAEQMGDLEHALSAYENALRHNPNSLSGLTQVAGIARIKENFPKAVDYFQRALALQQDNGEVWSALGHCYLMQDELQKAYAAYQQALYLLPNPKEDPRLWYGIGILYDRYGSLDHAEEAFSSVLRMDKSVFTPDFDKANEILFRLGIIYKQQGKYQQSLECFDRILRNPPSPLAHADIWFQIGHVYEQQKDLARAKDAYERVVEENPNHSKVLQQLGWIYHQDGSSFQNQDVAIAYLTKSLEADPTDAQSWYLLGRAYMAGQKYNKAYEAYQQAVYRDGRNPTFWCSIGVLYFQINQFRDALDAYSRAIRINPYISEVWFDLGSLYESCNNQITDAIDAYMRAAELDPHNTAITQRLQLLKQAQATGGALPAAPGPTDVHPTAYANSMVGPQGPPIHFHTGSRPPPGPDGRSELALQPPPPPPRIGSPPFGGRAPPPLVLDESRQHPGHTPFAPMEVDRPPHAAGRGGYPPLPSRDGPPSRGPGGPSSVLLHHPVPQPQVHPDDLRNGQPHPNDPYARRDSIRRLSTTTPPPPHSGRRSPSGPYPPPYARGPVGPGQANGGPPPQHSPYAYDPAHGSEHDRNFERRAHAEAGWEREQRERRTGRPSEYPLSAQTVYTPRNQSPPLPQSAPRARSPRRRERSPSSPHSPRPNGTRGYWDARTAGGPHHVPPPRAPSPLPPPPPQATYAPEPASRARYDPRFDGRTTPMEPPRSFASSPEATRNNMAPPPDRSVSPSGSSVTDSRNGRRPRKENVDDHRRKKREAPKPRVKEEPVNHLDRTTSARATPGPSSGGSHHDSIEPSPTSAGAQPPRRSIDEDYDEGVADALMSLSGSGQERPSHSHRNSVSSNVGRGSPPAGSSSGSSLKRPGSPRSEEEVKRSRLDAPLRRRSSESNGLATPLPSSRPSPIPFRTQPGSANPLSPTGGDAPGSGSGPNRRLTDGPGFNATSPRLPAKLPPPPRPHGGTTHHMPLPPITTLPQASSPRSSSGPASPASEDRMQVDVATARRSSQSPQTRAHKITDMIHASPPARPPTAPAAVSPKRTASAAGEKNES